MKTYKLLINQNLCDGCGNCQKSCPINASLMKKNEFNEKTAAIYVHNGKAHNGIGCDGCGVCFKTCHKAAISIKMTE